MLRQEPIWQLAQPTVLCWLATVDPILAPGYRFYPQDTTEQGQMDAAMRRYGVKPQD